RQPDASDGIPGAQSRGPDSRERHERGSRRGPGRSELPRAYAAQPAAAGESAPQALRPTNTSSSSRTRYVKPQISHSPNVYEGTYSSPRIVGSSVLPWVAGNAVRGVPNTDVISGPGLASSGTVEIGTHGTTSNYGLLAGARGTMWT